MHLKKYLPKEVLHRHNIILYILQPLSNGVSSDSPNSLDHDIFLDSLDGSSSTSQPDHNVLPPSPKPPLSLHSSADHCKDNFNPVSHGMIVLIGIVIVLVYIRVVQMAESPVSQAPYRWQNLSTVQIVLGLVTFFQAPLCTLKGSAQCWIFLVLRLPSLLLRQPAQHTCSNVPTQEGHM